MSIIIRLQNLPWEANSLDIRRYFQGLSIPDGGVHIVGGEKGDAFIAFSSDEDARQAMARDDGIIKDSRVKLYLSSRNEMQKIIEQARNQTLGIKNTEPVGTVNPIGLQTLPPIVPMGPVATSEPDRCRPPEIPREDRRGRNSPSNRSPPYVNEQYRHLMPNLDSEGIGRVDGDPKPVTGVYNQLPRKGLGFDQHLPHGPPNPRGWNRDETFDDHSLGVDLPYPIGDPRTADHRMVDPRIPDPRMVDPRIPDPRLADPRMVDPRLADPRMGDPRMVDPRMVDPRLADPRLADPRLADPRMGDPRVGSLRPIEIRGLPFNVVPRDIQDFMRTVGLYVPEEMIKILVDEKGYTTGGAIVRMASDHEVETALSLHGRFLDDRRIDVMPLPEAFPHDDRVLGPMMHPGRSNDIGRDYVVYMKGIPFNSCTPRDVAEFFGGIRCVDIVLETDANGKPAGNAFVEFSNPNDFNAALDLNMKHMGRRYIELFPTNRDDMNEARRMSMGPANDRRRERPSSEARLTYCVSVNGLPPAVTNRDLTNYFTEIGARPFAIHIMLKPNGMNAGEAFVEFVSADHQLRAIRQNGSTMGNHRITVRGVSYELMRSVVGIPPMNGADGTNGAAPSGMPGFRDERREKNRRKDKKEKNEDRRCVVIASNIPYRATNDDICVFFSDFNITNDCIMRRLNEKGQATADCKIVFKTPEDANRAVRLMHKKFLIGRPVFLRNTE